MTAKYVLDAKRLTFSSLQCRLLRSYFPAFLVVSYWTGLDLHTRCPGRNCSPHRRCTDCCSHKRHNPLFALSSSLMKYHWKDTDIMRTILFNNPQLCASNNMSSPVASILTICTDARIDCGRPRSRIIVSQRGISNFLQGSWEKFPGINDPLGHSLPGYAVIW